VTKSEFIDWKKHPVTKEVMSILKDRVEQLQFELGQSAGQDPLNDRFKCGAVAAYYDMIQIEVDTKEDSE
jgi:hypothetical protein